MRANWLKGRKCDRCGKESELVLGKFEHFLCRECSTEWGNFIQPFLSKLHDVARTPKWSELWEKIYAKFLAEWIEKVQFT
jgi:hypothetical protein